METLKEKTAKGLMWGGLSNGVQQLLNLVFGIFLARLLNADDYGMVGMLAIFSLLATAFIESGFTNSLARKKDASHRDFNAVFWCSLLIGVVLYAVLFVSAPLIARFFHQPELVPLSRFLFIAFVISSTAIVPNALFYRQLEVKKKAIAQITALMVSGVVGITMAWHHLSYWGIATQNVVYVTVFTVLMWWNTSWRPTLHIDFKPVREMLSFSSKLMLTNVFLHVNNNILSVLLGRWYTRADVGNYTQANKWNTMGYSLIANMISGVAMPVLNSVSDNRGRQRQVFRKMLRFTAFVSFPLMFGLALVSEEFITIAITDKWLPAAHLMQLLCIMGAFAPISTLYTNLIISDGRGNTYMWGSIGLGLMQIAVLTTMRQLGIVPMVATYAGLYVAWLLVWHYWAHRILGLSILEVLKDVVPFLLITAIALVATHFATQPIANVYLRFGAKIGCAALIYIGIMRLANAAILKESIEYIFKHKINE